MMASRSWRKESLIAARRHDDPVDDLHDDQRDVVAAECPPAGRHLVEDRAEREQIGPRIDG